MTLSDQNAERVIPFAILLTSLASFSVYESMSKANVLTGGMALSFWFLEVGMLIAGLLFLCPRFSWPSKKLGDFALKTVKVAAIASLILAFPSLALDVAFGMTILGGDPASQGAGFPSTLGYEFLQEAAILFVPCLILSTAVNWLKHSGPFASKVADSIPIPSTLPTPSEQVHSRPEFWEKLQRRRHGRLLALEAQEHYVLVHTTAGKELILYRFSDAVEQLAEWEGAQVHRSFWIARSAIKDIIVKGRKSSALLTNGVEIPISRRRKQEALAKFAP